MNIILHLQPFNKRKIEAGVVKLVDTLDLGSSASRCEGSSPFARTHETTSPVIAGFCFL